MANEILSNEEVMKNLEEINPADFTILIVDDVAANVMLLKMMLAREKYNVITCSESPKVHGICLEQHPDLILHDVMMPVMTGYDVAQQLKADPLTADIPIIFLTAYYDKEHTLKGFASGGSDYISKPFEKEILLARVNVQLKLASATRMVKERNASLSETLTSRDKMYSVIAHDLRGPLGVVQLSLKALSDMISPDLIGEDLHGMLTECNKQVSDVFNLLDNLLKWTKSQTGALKVVYQDFLVTVLTEPIIDMYGSMASLKGIRLTLGNVDGSLSIHSDADMVKTVLRNFITNAIKFTETGKEVRIDVCRDGDFAAFSVTDQGCGLTEEELGKLFHKDTHFTKYGTNREEGSGLGLMLCKGFADQLGGCLRVSSKPGEGSTFTICVPLSI